MATRIYAISPGQNEFDVTEGVGAPTAGGTVNVTIDLASLITDASAPGGVRPITKEEALLALEKIENHILSKNWTPA